MCTNLMLSVPATVGESSPQVYVSARTLELSSEVSTAIYLVPRAQTFPLESPPPPPTENPLSWTNQYGFVGVGAGGAVDFQVSPAFVDGLNERGLSVASLWLPGTVYPSSGPNPQVFFSDLGAWMLGNFESVSDIESQLGTISVVGPPIPTPGGETHHYLPLHFIATDATGQSLIIEFSNGQMVVYGPSYENGATSNGVLTNSPTYDQQVANLINYKGLTVIGAATSLTGGGPPVGSGLLGLPGDPTSISRFVRATILREGFTLLPPAGSGWLPAPNGSSGFAGPVQTVVNVALQLVQIVMETPYGMLLQQPPPPPPPPPPTIGDWTQWTVARDHTNLAFYFTSTFNNIPRLIDLNQIDFASGPGFPKLNSIPLNPPDPDWSWNVPVQFATP